MRANSPQATPPRRPSRSDLIFLMGVLGLGAIGVVAINRFSHQPTPVNATVAEAQSTPLPVIEPVAVSRVTHIALPNGAETMRQEEIVTDAARQLQQRATDLAPNLAMNTLEVVTWPRQGSAKAPAAITNEVQQQLQRSGYLYKQTASNRQNSTTIREFVAVSRAAKSVVPGFWMETDEFLLLGWASFKPKPTP